MLKRQRKIAASLHALFLFLFASSWVFADTDSLSHLRLDPHAYAGERGAEPSTQLVVQALERWGNATGSAPWRIQLHAEGEISGRRDVSFDIDRAWIRLPAPWLSSSAAFYLGRIHPWDVSGSPEAERPWGLLAQSQPQNRGVLLGYGFHPENDSPDPILLGWVGAHYWSDTRGEDPFAFGVSATPFFVPSLGSEVSLSKNESLSTGRFGRRPPGTLEVNGARFPIRYDIDHSRVFEDIVLQPQVAATAYFHPVARSESWLTVMRGPSPDPSTDAQGFLSITPSGTQAIASVRPRFPSRFLVNLSQRFRIAEHFAHSALFASVAASEEKKWGYELGAGNDYASVAVLNERSWTGVVSSLQIADASFTDWLLQGDARVPLGLVTLFTGAKTHLGQGDIWVRAGARLQVGRGASLDLGGDAFGGGDLSYFGEWRTNNRVYTVFNWEIGA